MADYVVRLTDGSELTICAACIADVHALCYDMGISADEIASVVLDN